MGVNPTEACPSCGRYPVNRDICMLCRRVLDDSILLKLERRMYVRVKEWSFRDIDGKEHEVVALQWGDAVLHFGEDGLFTD